MKSDNRICSNCRFYRYSWWSNFWDGPDDSRRCAHPLSGKIDIVSGKHTMDRCKSMRGYGACEAAGKLFAEKPPEPKYYNEY